MTGGAEAADVIVIGAGLAGTSLAYTLADRGWSVLLADRHSFQRHKVCGEFLSPESSRSLAALGLESLIRQLKPAHIDSVRITAASGATLTAQLPGQALGVSRYVLDQALLEAAGSRGVTVRTGLYASKIHTMDKDGYEVVFRSAEGMQTVKSKVLIGAWGRSGFGSGARQHATRRSYVGIKTHLQSEALGTAVELYFSEKGYVGVSPIEGGRWNAAALVSREAFRDSGSNQDGMWGSLGMANPSFQERMETADRIPGTEAAVAPVIPGIRLSPWDRAPHVGDAAAVIPPLSGDGMAFALRSVELCAELADRYLQGKLSLAEWRERYETLLRAEFTGPLRWAVLLQAALQNQRLAPALLRLGAACPWLASYCIRSTRLIR